MWTNVAGRSPKRCRILLLFRLAMVALASISLAALERARAEHPLEEWSQREPLPTSRELTGIAFGEGRYVVACGDPAGRVLVSSDGDSFAFEDLSLPEGLAASRVIYDHGVWIVIAAGKVWMKPLWENEWMEGGSTSEPVVEVRAANGEFWAWSHGGFVGRGETYRWESSKLYHSVDGADWTDVSVTEENLSISEILYAEGRFVISNSGFSYTTTGLWGSVDGTQWDALVGDRGLFDSLEYGGGRFVAAGRGGRLAYSDDGVEWTEDVFPFIASYVSGSPVHSDVYELDFVDGRFLARAEGWSFPILAESDDGVSWLIVATLRDPDRPVQTNDLDGETYFLGSHGYLWKGSDWDTDRQRLLPYEPWNWKGVAASGSRLVVAGEGGHVAWSDDGVQFNHLLLPAPADVLDLVWADELGVFLAVGGEGETARAWRSVDGVSWMAIELPTFSKAASGVAWGGGQFVACGAGGELAGSADGFSWIARASGVVHSLDNIEWGGGHFAAAGEGGAVIYSSDAHRWQQASFGFDDLARVSPISVVYGRGLWAFGRDYNATLTVDFRTSWPSSQWALNGNPVFAFGEFIYSNHRYVRSTSDGLEAPSRYEGMLSIDPPYEVPHGFYRGARFQDRMFFVGQDGLIGASGEWRDFYLEWCESHFSAAELADEEFSGALADPDCDGWVNAFEYAFRLDPKAGQEAGETRLYTRYWQSHRSRFVGDHFHFRHPWGHGPPGVSVWVEQSRDLLTWVESELYSDTGWWRSGDSQIHYADREVPMRTAQPLYLRLRAEIVRP